MKSHEKRILSGLVALVALALGAMIFTRDWANYRERLRALRSTSRQSANPVDMRPLDRAQQLAQLAVTHMEQDYAQQALRFADHSVDLAFAAAIQDATENPPPLTPQTRELSARIKAGEAAVAADQSRITQFTLLVSRAKGDAKSDLQELIAIAQAQLALDEDDLEDARQDLIRAGGDRQATIQRLLDQHKASSAQSAGALIGAAAGAAPSIELTQSRSLSDEARAWMSLRSKQSLLVQAQEATRARAAKLSEAHDALEKRLEEGPPAVESAAGGATNVPAAAGSQSAKVKPGETVALARLRHVTEEKKKLTDFDKRIETEQQLAGLYANWIMLVDARAKTFLHRISVSVFAILLIALLAALANSWIQRIFAAVALERRQMHTLRAVTLYGVQALGLVLILLVIFGMPSNFATVLALAGAGLTVAMKDFIVGFFGWFVLMGKDGIRAGDWVEIKGVGGEVLKVGPLHTVILETGNWTDPGHPTGRKVSFVNSFAIEGHYFNFSTKGQWLWDEIQVQIPDTAEPYATAEAMQKIAADETAANARLAEEEWNRVTPAQEKRAFSAAPSLSVRPIASGVNVVLRYITRASERYEVRTRIYRAVVELLRKKKIPESAAATPSSQTAVGRD
jgi:small-conductance mechanosensitive channel